MFHQQNGGARIALRGFLGAGLMALAALPLRADAGCAGQLVMGCTIGKKELSLCLTSAGLTYQFGPAGRPEISLTRPLAVLDYQPWPGVGFDIWEQVSFSNDRVRYEVWSSAPRDAAGVASGGVNVVEGERVLAALTCVGEPQGLGLPAIGDALAEHGG